jgi:hypothetical protein
MSKVDKREVLLMVYEIRCKVFPRQFSSEFAVKGVQANGTGFSLFAPATTVETDEPPTRDRAVDGWLEVQLWEQAGDQAVVRLPRESFESGRFVTMTMSQLKTRPTPIETRE